ncbi:MAG: amino acid adenylation domain-containing protein, partial [Cytophagales bacterium]|nr:amino acid adenylation domain-containing protein [Cytophagales bacterium]
EHTRITYRQLNERANRLAHFLRSRYQVRPDDPVGIMLEKSDAMIVAVLGVLKAGAAYVPIDPKYPQSHINFIIEDTRVVAVITEASVRSRYDLAPSPKYLDLAAAAAEGNDANPPDVNSARDLAYIMYTSGSTGLPKGVMVEHRSVVRLVRNTNYVTLTDTHRVLMTGSLSFDASTFEIWGALLNGGQLHVAAYETLLDVASFKAILLGSRIDAIFLTAAWYNQLVDADVDMFASLQYLLVGGDKLSVAHINKVRRAHPRVKVLNGYGPTENTTFSIVHAIEATYEHSIPLGRPIANSLVYILDEEGNRVPKGVTGEIYVGGDGLARGYLNRDELTAEKFVPSPFRPGERLYKTGDLGMWLPDGTIDFLGRKDFQVKIRGYRIELPEIENAMLKNEEVSEAVVQVVEREGVKELVAYFTTTTGLKARTLKAHLAQLLPAYMIPSHFIPLEKFPLTINGKIDRPALPLPETLFLAGENDYLAPQNEIEEKLVNIWKDVLGRKVVGVKDNFFELGGDSIKAIQISSRLSSQNYRVEVRDIFKQPTVQELSLKVVKQESSVDQGAVEGEVPLTPIQREFFGHYQLRKEHFNQSVMLHSAERLDEDALRAVFRKLAEHHDALRMGYQVRGESTVQWNKGLAFAEPSIATFDLRAAADPVETLEREANRLQAGIDLAEGPLLKIGLFRLGDGDRLLIVIHHLVVDGVSWRVLFEDIGLLMQQYKTGEPLALPPKTESFKVWSEKLLSYAQTEGFLAEKGYWQQVLSREAATLPRDFQVKDNLLKDVRAYAFALDAAETDALLTKANGAYNTEINDILLTALGLCFHRLFGVERLAVWLEGHGREGILENVNISRTVGWFTSVYPILLETNHPHQLSRQIKEVKESLRAVPNRGIGYGMMKYLSKANLDREFAHQLCFNYLGQFDSDIGNTSFTVARESGGQSQSLDGSNRFQLTINGMIIHNRLDMVIHYNQNHYRRETIESMWHCYRDALREVIDFCAAAETGTLTPSDLTFKELSIDEIETFFN